MRVGLRWFPWAPREAWSPKPGRTTSTTWKSRSRTMCCRSAVRPAAGSASCRKSHRLPGTCGHASTALTIGVSSAQKSRQRQGLEGDFSVSASSGADAEVTGIKGGNVKAHSSSGSQVKIAGSCVSLEAHASSGSDLDAEDLKCENASIHTSSGSEISVAAAKSVTGEGSSGSQIRVRGKPTNVQVDTSSGAEISIKE